MAAACRWAVLVNPLLEKPPTNGALCTAWILQGPFDVSTWLNWYMFYQGQQGVRGRFLDMWEYLAGAVSSGSLLLHSHRFYCASKQPIWCHDLSILRIWANACMKADFAS